MPLDRRNRVAFVNVVGTLLLTGLVPSEAAVRASSAIHDIARGRSNNHMARSRL